MRTFARHPRFLALNPHLVYTFFIRNFFGAPHVPFRKRIFPIPASSAPLLQAEGVTVRFDACERPFDVVRDVSFAVRPGRTFCLVGESGCGKSMTARAFGPRPRTRTAGRGPHPLSGR